MTLALYPPVPLRCLGFQIPELLNIEYNMGVVSYQSSFTELTHVCVVLYHQLRNTFVSKGHIVVCFDRTLKHSKLTFCKIAWFYQFVNWSCCELKVKYSIWKQYLSDKHQQCPDISNNLPVHQGDINICLIFHSILPLCRIHLVVWVLVVFYHALVSWALPWWRCLSD